MKRLIRGAATVATSLGLIGGFAGVAGASSGSISYTGPDSVNRISSHSYTRTHVENDNEVGVTNNNPQSAWSGHAGVYHNTTGGSAYSGDATNRSSFNATLRVDNSGSTRTGSTGSSHNTGTIDHTGPDSYNSISFRSSNHVDVENNNDINVTNNNEQHASSGSAVVAGNTTGGSAVSGDASNTSTTTVNIDIKN